MLSHVIRTMRDLTESVTAGEVEGSEDFELDAAKKKRKELYQMVCYLLGTLFWSHFF